MTPTAFPLPLRRQILILAALFVLSLPLVTTRLYASDEVQYFSYLRSLWFDHDVSFENEYQHFYDAGTVRYDGFRETFLERTTETGRRVNFGTIGSALLWSPFYAVADAYARVARSWGSTVAADGYSAPYVAAVAYGSACYAWLALLCGLGIARHVLLDPLVPPDVRNLRDPRDRRDSRASRDPQDPRARELHEAYEARDTQNLRDSRNARVERRIFAATLAIWIGTPLFFYMYIAPPMAHACSAFVVSAFVLAWLKVRTQWSLRGMILLGALAALMGMTREQDLFIAIGPALDWAVTLWQRLRADAVGSGASAARPVSVPLSAPAPGSVALVLHAIAGAAAFALAYTPQLAAYVALNGYPGPTRLVARKMNLLAPHAFGVLLSPRHGLLFWTPLVLLALAGLVWLALRRDDEVAATRGPAAALDRRRIALCMLAIVASQVYIAGSVESWTVAGAFGQRRFVGLSAVFLLGLAALLVQARDGWMRRGAVTLASLAIWWNLAMMAQFATGLMDRQRLELGRNAYHAFVTIPGRVPELAYRYIFARRSFYKPPIGSAPSGGARSGDAPSVSAPAGSAPTGSTSSGDNSSSDNSSSDTPSGRALSDSVPPGSVPPDSTPLDGTPSGARWPDRAIEARGVPRSATTDSRSVDTGRLPMSRATAAVPREARA